MWLMNISFPLPKNNYPAIMQADHPNRTASESCTEPQLLLDSGSTHPIESRKSDMYFKIYPSFFPELSNTDK